MSIEVCYVMSSLHIVAQSAVGRRARVWLHSSFTLKQKINSAFPWCAAAAEA